MPTRTALPATRLARVKQALARLRPAADRKSGPLIAVESPGFAVWMPRDYAAFAREGMMQNAVVYRCIRMIAEAAASVPVLLYDGEEEIADHSFRDLIARPDPCHTAADLFEAWYSFLLVAGNAYLETVAFGGTLRELHVLRPDRMKVVPGLDGWPESYEYTVGNRTVQLGGEAVPGVRSILHLKLFHPANDHYGLSPIEAAATAIDIHNAASRWNKALLDNSARPSGALVYSTGGHMTGDQFARLRGELETSFQGTRNAGRPLLLEGGLDWKAMSLSPRDMDFIEAKHAAAREIALALGVPPMLLGIPGDNTYSNLQEANRAFWRQTVLPLVNRTLAALSAWLAPAWGGGLSLRPDLDQIEALSAEREALWARLEKASFLTTDEKRAAVGYGPVNGRDEIARKFRPDQPRVAAGSPDGGQWTSEDGDGSDDPGDGKLDPNDNSGDNSDRPQPIASRPKGPRPTANPKGPAPVPPGQALRNQALAAKKHPETGIPFDRQGFPDFSGVSRKTVGLPHTGDRIADFAAANRSAGYSETPPGFTWHHHQDGYTMQLVPRDLHTRTGHTGSIGIGNTPGRK